MTYRILTLLLITVIVACATVSNPLGGQKDETSPTLLLSNPTDQATKYNKQEITLSFDEWIKVNQLNKELIITPITGISYTYTNKKNNLTLTFDNKLQDSTTYTLNFRKAITDITEGNIWEDAKIAFSTGDFLDSMQINGTIKTLLTDKPAPQYLVGLYPSAIDTANLRQGKPLYFTSTDERGYYTMTNIKSGKYLLYAFSDKNDNLINNSSEESYAFYHNQINLIDTIKSLDLRSYFSNEDTLQIKNNGPSGKDYKVSISKPLANYDIKIINQPTKHIYSALNETHKEITIFAENFTIIDRDSIHSIITISDSIGNVIQDTLFLKFRESKIENEMLTIVSKPITDITSGSQAFQFTLNKPIYTINYDSLYIGLNDSIIAYQFSEKDIHLNKQRNTITINSNLSETTIDTLIAFHQNIRLLAKQDTTSANPDSLKNQGKSFIESSPKLRPTLILRKGAFTGIEQDTLNSQKYSLTFMNMEDYGSIEGHINDSTSTYVIELLSDKHILQARQNTKSHYKFTYVKPGKYHIRVIRDSNNNSKWDPGNPLTLQPYEEVIHYKELITVKANWEILDINIDTSLRLENVHNSQNK